MGHFALTCQYELSNEAFETSTALLLGIPVPHARFLHDHVVGYENMDLWADAALNSSIHASNTRKITHDRLAQELASIASGAGIPTSSQERYVPYRDDDSRKRADLITLVGGIVPPSTTKGFTH